MSPRHNKRVRDAILRNSRPTKQLRLIDPHKRRMPEKGTKITVHYTEKEKDLLERVKAFTERHGIEVEFKEVVEK